MTPARRPVAHLRPPNSGLPLPEGWVAEQLRWGGADHEVAYDPARIDLLRVVAGVDADARRRLAGAGWERVGTDADGDELWVLDRTGRALDRLDHLTHAATPSNDLAVGT
jgi:hypothetical protein